MAEDLLVTGFIKEKKELSTTTRDKNRKFKEPLALIPYYKNEDL